MRPYGAIVRTKPGYRAKCFGRIRRCGASDSPTQSLWLESSDDSGGVGSRVVLRCAQNDGKNKNNRNGKNNDKRRFPSGMTNFKR